MPTVSCKICGEEFYAKPSHLKQGWGKYCSAKCQYKSYRKGKFVYCGICDKKTWRAPKRLKHSKSGKYFCSKSCHMTWKNKILHIGENHPNWIGGEFATRGILRRSSRKRTCVHCGNSDERILVVHHKDVNPRNNKLSNLIWLCHNCHHLIHYHNISV